MANILLLVAQDGFQTMEYGEPKRILEAAGHHVVTGATEAGTARSNVGEEVIVDMPLRDAHAQDFDAVFAIGGPGALKHLDNAETARIMTEAKEGNKFYGAICVSPRILAKAGVLSDVHATGWNGDGKLESIYMNAGVIYDKLPVVIDGKVVTADGPLSASGFGEAIKNLLAKTE